MHFRSISLAIFSVSLSLASCNKQTNSASPSAKKNEADVSVEQAIQPNFGFATHLPQSHSLTLHAQQPLPFFSEQLPVKLPDTAWTLSCGKEFSKNLHTLGKIYTQWKTLKAKERISTTVQTLIGQKETPTLTKDFIEFLTSREGLTRIEKLECPLIVCAFHLPDSQQRATVIEQSKNSLFTTLDNANIQYQKTATPIGNSVFQGAQCSAAAFFQSWSQQHSNTLENVAPMRLKTLRDALAHKHINLMVGEHAGHLVISLCQSPQQLRFIQDPQQSIAFKPALQQLSSTAKDPVQGFFFSEKDALVAAKRFLTFGSYHARGTALALNEISGLPSATKLEKQLDKLADLERDCLEKYDAHDLHGILISKAPNETEIIAHGGYTLPLLDLSAEHTLPPLTTGPDSLFSARGVTASEGRYNLVNTMRAFTNSEKALHNYLSQLGSNRKLAHTAATPFWKKLLFHLSPSLTGEAAIDVMQSTSGPPKLRVTARHRHAATAQESLKKLIDPFQFEMQSTNKSITWVNPENSLLALNGSHFLFSTADNDDTHIERATSGSPRAQAEASLQMRLHSQQNELKIHLQISDKDSLPLWNISLQH